MTDSQMLVLAVAGLYAGALVLVLVLQARRARVERRLFRMSVTVGLRVPDNLEHELLRHISRRGRAWLLGYAVGVLGIALPVLLLAPDLIGPFGLALVILGFAGGSAASVAVALRDRRRGSFGTTTVARLGGPTITDLVPLRPIIATTVFVAMALTVSIAMLLLPRPAEVFFNDLRLGALAMAVGSLLALAGWWWGSRAIASTRPITGDVATLQWSDALRAESIRDLLLLPFISALVSLQIGTPLLVRAIAPELTDLATAVGMYGALVIVILMGLFWFDARSAQHFQRRLWAEQLAASRVTPAETSRA